MQTHKVKFSSSYRTKDRDLEEPVFGELDELVFPENAAVAKVSVGSDLPVKLAPFLNAKQSVHITVPCYAEETSIKKAYEFASNFCQEHLTLKLQEYMTFLDNNGVDYNKIEKGVK